MIESDQPRTVVPREMQQCGVRNLMVSTDAGDDGPKSRRGERGLILQISVIRMRHESFQKLQ